MAGAVLVAGGTGALGSAVVRDLVAAGHPVTATWVVESERERLEGQKGVTLVEADLLDAGVRVTGCRGRRRACPRW